MDPVDINALIEQAKRNASGVPGEKPAAIPPPEETKEASDIDVIMGEVGDALEIEEIEEEMKKKAAQDRRRNVTIAKLLAAADVFSGVSQ